MPAPANPIPDSVIAAAAAADGRRGGEGGGDARARLVAAGIEAFGRAGYEAASIRAIAKAADVNIAGVSYHFGGKEGLYRACAEFIVKTIEERLALRLAGVRPAAGLAPAEAGEAALAMLRGVVRTLLAEPRMDFIARFVVREQMDPTPVFAILYEGIMRPLHERFSALWAAATGTEPEARETLLKAFAVIGQAIVFRVGRATVFTRLGWTGMGPEEAAEIEEIIVTNVAALIAAETERHRADPSAARNED